MLYYINLFPNPFQDIWDPNLSIIGIANWIPFFWIFWAAQPFLDSPKKRERFALVLVAGSVPLLITGFGQYFFNWTGPFQTLNGLVVWYQRPIKIATDGLTGLFNNQNYTGSWFNLVLPFCLALVFKKSNNFLKSLSISFLLSISFSIFLTYSRNAWLGMLLALLLGKDANIYYSWICVFNIFDISNFSGALQSNILQIIPKIFVDQFSPDAFKLDSTRLDLIVSAIEVIKTSPIVGIGAGSFTLSTN